MQQQTFDKLYFNFWKRELNGARLVRECELIVQLAGLLPPSKVLDLGAGGGRISIELARKGMHVVAVERSEHALAEALQVAHANCEFVKCDWRERPWREKFDCVLLWFTTLCAGRVDDLHTLRIAHASLRGCGSLLIETRHWDRPERRFDDVSERRFGDWRLVERHSYDPITGVQTTHETYEIGDDVVERTYQIRRYSFVELRELCADAGFQRVDGFDERGDVLSGRSERAVLRARLK